MIVSNQGRCRLCGDEPYSAHRHDMTYCKCGEVAVDGGTAYLRRVAGSFDNFIELSIEITDKAFKEITAELDKEIAAEVVSIHDLLDRIFQLLEKHDIVPLITEEIGMPVIRAAALKGTVWALDTGRNGFGLLSAVMREVRDCGSGWYGEGTEV